MGKRNIKISSDQHRCYHLIFNNQKKKSDFRIAQQSGSKFSLSVEITPYAYQVSENLLNFVCINCSFFIFLFIFVIEILVNLWNTRPFLILRRLSFVHIFFCQEFLPNPTSGINKYSRIIICQNVHRTYANHLQGCQLFYGGSGGWKMW